MRVPVIGSASVIETKRLNESIEQTQLVGRSAANPIRVIDP